jgi:hypothetical protein
MIDRLRHRPLTLLLVPVATYAVSYIYLAWYHGDAFLIGTVIHESGRYTLAENTFYAPHFLGHIPVLVTLALLMVGSYRGLTPSPPASSRREIALAAAAMVLLLGGSLVLSLAHWGVTETWEFICQQRQRPDLLVPGGSWLLHLPSTISLCFGLPLFVLAVRWFYRRPTGLASRGLPVFALGILSLVAITVVVVPQPIATSVEVLRDPRILGHAIRELATFPLTYFSLPLAWWLAREPEGAGFCWTRSLLTATVITGGVFAAILAYQIAIPLEHGIGHLTQHPEFAHDDGLSIPYLLASHYFEHFLDSLFFALLCVLLTRNVAFDHGDVAFDHGQGGPKKRHYW